VLGTENVVVRLVHHPIGGLNISFKVPGTENEPPKIGR